MPRHMGISTAWHGAGPRPRSGSKRPISSAAPPAASSCHSSSARRSGGTAIPGGPGRGREGGLASLSPRRPAPPCPPATSRGAGHSRAGRVCQGAAGRPGQRAGKPPEGKEAPSRRTAATRTAAEPKRALPPGAAATSLGAGRRADAPRGVPSARRARPQPGFKGAASRSCAGRHQPGRGLAGRGVQATSSARSHSVFPLLSGLLPNLSPRQDGQPEDFPATVPRHLFLPQEGRFLRLLRVGRLDRVLWDSSSAASASSLVLCGFGLFALFPFL